MIYTYILVVMIVLQYTDDIFKIKSENTFMELQYNIYICFEMYMIIVKCTDYTDKYTNDNDCCNKFVFM